MSGTESIIALEKEDGVYSVYVNYDSDFAFFYLYFVHNKREDWEYIIEQGQVSSIGSDLRTTEREAIFRNGYSTFYKDSRNDYGLDLDASHYKDLQELLDSCSKPPFLFFMDKNNEIFVASDYYKPDDSLDENWNEKRTIGDLIPIKEYVEKYIDDEHLRKRKDYIDEKRFKSDTFFVECQSEKEQEEKYQDLLNRKGDEYHVFKEDNGFNVFCVSRDFLRYHNKYY